MRKQLSNFSFGEVLNRKAQVSITGGKASGGFSVTCSITCPGAILPHEITCDTGCSGSENCVKCSGGTNEFCCIIAA